MSSQNLLWADKKRTVRYSLGTPTVGALDTRVLA